MKVEVSIETQAIDRSDVIETIAVEVKHGLERYRDKVTRVDVHLRDMNGPRSGVDRRCSLEARPAGLDPVAVTNDATTVAEAVKGAIGKMDRMLSSLFGKMEARKSGMSASGLPT